MIKLVSITGLTLAIAVYGEGGHNFTTGTYKVCAVEDNNTTYLIEFSINQAENRIAMLSSMSSIIGNMSEMREFEYRAGLWHYQYEHWSFDSCSELLGNTFICTEPKSGKMLCYSITKINDHFDPSFNLLHEAAKKTATINGNESTDGCKFHLSGYCAPYNLDLEQGGVRIREREDWSSPVAVRSVNNGSLMITVNDLPINLKNFSRYEDGYEQFFSKLSIDITKESYKRFIQR